MELPTLIIDDFFWADILYPKDYIYEGLIHTYSIESSLAIIKNACGVTQDRLTVPKDRNTFDLNLKGYNKDKIEEINKKALVCGWFVAYYTKGSEKFRTDKLDNALSSLIPFSLVGHYEAKYDVTVGKYPPFLYHATSKIYLEKILRVGLEPRSKNIIAGHPERVYFGLTPEAAEKVMVAFWNQKTPTEKAADWGKGEFVVLKIDVGNENKLRLFKDPNYPDKAVYTMNNIRQSSITVDKEFTLAI